MFYQKEVYLQSDSGGDHRSAVGLSALLHAGVSGTKASSNDMTSKLLAPPLSLIIVRQLMAHVPRMPRTAESADKALELTASSRATIPTAHDQSKQSSACRTSLRRARAPPHSHVCSELRSDLT